MLNSRTVSAFLAFCMIFSVFTCTIPVSAAETPTKVELNYKDLEINLANTYDTPLYVSVGYYTEPSANGKVTWKSSNEAVATVDQTGRVKPISEGTTVITAIHKDYPSAPVTCNVTVYSTHSQTYYYVSPNGSDAATGTETEPFATIQKARDTIRALPEIPKGGVTVILEDGKYFTPETILFTPKDSGTRDNPIIYKARHAGKAIITGEVPITGWNKAPDSDELSPLAKGKVYVADVGTGWRFHDLYVNGERQQVSRAYNTDSWRNWPIFYGRGPISYDPVKGTRVVFGNGELDGLDGKEDIEVALLPVMYWNSIPLLKYIDAKNKTAYLQSKVPSNFWPDHFGTNEGYYNILNALKYLDEPGEWSVDSQAGKVYYWPKDEKSINTDHIVAPKPYELIKLQGDGVDQNFENLVKYITFDGLNFQYTDRLPETEFPDDWIIRNAENPDAALYFDGTENCKIVNSEIKHSGSYGIMINHYGQRNEILHNQLSDLGSGGIQLFGYGVGTTDVNKNNIVMFNSVFKMGVAPYQHSPGLSLFGSGLNTLAYNYIAGAPYAGISIVGTDENSVSATNPDTRAAYDLFGNRRNQYGIRFEELKKLPASEKDGKNGEYFSIGTLAEKYQHSVRNVAEYNILDDYSQSMDDGGALYSWYSGLGNVYAYNILKEQLQGQRTWVFRLYMDDRALGFTLEKNLTSGYFGATINKSFAPYDNRWIDNGYAVFPAVPTGYDAQRKKILDDVQRMAGGFKLPDSANPIILTPVNGSTQSPVPTTFHWSQNENASLYKLEIAKDADFKQIVKTIETSATVASTSELDFNTQYYCRVTTREYLQPSRTSEIVSFKTDGQKSPTDIPQGIKITNNIGAVLVQWTPILNTAVNVYRKGVNDQAYVQVAQNISGNGYLDSSVEGKKTYSYIIAAVNPAGEGPQSEPVNITTGEREVLFEDTFDTVISDLWIDASGNKVKNIPGAATVQGGKWIPAGNWKEYYVGIGNKQWSDYAVEADITFDGLQPGAESYSGFGLITRANNAGKVQFYQSVIRSNDNKIEFVKKDGNNWTTYASKATANKPVAGTVYKMRVENLGDIKRTYLNGVLVSETTDNSYASGGIGIGYGKDYIKVDNVRVIKNVQPKEYTVTINQGANGNIASNTVGGKVTAGADVEFTFTPANGYKVKRATVNGANVALVDNKYTVTNIQADITVTAEFESNNPSVMLENYYVSISGSDLTGDGSIEKPFATIEKAKHAVKANLAAGLTKDVHVYVRGGTYYLADAIKLDETDSGNNGFKVIYTSFNNENVSIVGGKPVTGWTDTGSNGIYKADITGSNNFWALFDNGRRLTNAYETNWKNVAVADKSHLQAKYGNSTSWFGEVLKVKTLSGSSVSTDVPVGAWSGNLEYLQGAKEYIDKPGEWAISDNTLYYKPLDGTNLTGHEIIAPTTDRIFYLQGTEGNRVKNIVIQGMNMGMNDFGPNLIAHAGRGTNNDQTAEYPDNLKGLVDLDYTENIQIRDSKLTNAGYMGVVINHYGQNNTVYGNYIEDTGYAGIFLIGENPGSLKYFNKNNVISNNEIKNVGKFVGHGSGIYLMNSGENQITHNNISGVPRYGISMKGIRYGVFAANGITGVPFEDHYKYNQTTRNYIGYNTIYNTGSRSGDGGGVESWGIGRDNHIDHNIIYNAYRGVPSAGWRGHSIFMDDGSHHEMATNNIVYDENAVSTNAGMMMKSIGSYVSNNVLDVGYQTNGAVDIEPYIEPADRMVFEKNIIYNDTPGSLNANGTWNSAGNGSRVMFKINDASTSMKALESMANMNKNVYFNKVGESTFLVLGQSLSLEQWKSASNNTGKYDKDSILADPNFKDTANRDYRLNADSPAFAQGIRSIESSKIGLLPDYKFASNDNVKTLFITATNNTQAAAALPVGKTVQLAVSARTEKGYALDKLTGVTFSSNNPDAVTVSANGLATAIGNDTAIITASYGGKTDRYTIYAGDTPNTIEAEDIALAISKNEAALVNPMIRTAGGKTLGDVDIVYSAVDPSIATVDASGRVEAKKNGSTAIVITANVSGETLTKQITVKVLSKKLVSISTPEFISAPIGAAKTAEALGLPKVSLVTDEGNVDAIVTWDLSGISYDPAIKTVQSFTVPGIVTLPASVSNPNNVSLTTSISVIVNKLPQSQMTATATSQETVSENNAASMAIDGNPTTFWHTKWDKSNPLPQSIILNLGGTNNINKVTVLPRPNGGNGNITGYNVYVSTDGTTFTKVASGNWANDTTEKTAIFESTNASYVKFEATAGVNGWASAAEINVYLAPPAVPTLVGITSPANITGVANGTANTAEALGLPVTVEMVTDRGSVNANVTWNVGASSYNPTLKTEQTFTVTGTVALPENVANPNNIALSTSIQVTVNATASSNSMQVVLSGNANIQSGASFDLTYGLQHVTGAIYAQELTLTYDPAKLDFVSAESMKDGFTIVDQDRKTGQVHLVAASLGEGKGVTTDGPLLALRMQAKSQLQNAAVTITITNMTVADRMGAETKLPNASHSIQIIAAVTKEELIALINEAQAAHEAAAEGTSPGQYPIGSKEVLQTAIDNAKAVAHDEHATQQQVDQAMVDLSTALQAFKDSVVKRMLEDLNGDGKISIGDLAIAAQSYGRTSTDSNWNQVKHADLNGDGKIDIVDLTMVASKILNIS
ncbi:discoidin domain-containing protein [Paenibacillus sp. GCM10027629]|uniref:discoidin domain-containing protein n=1 Tax=Paenibacillus sp. GCM10027629 TaxID=3273414 RepID=UPI003640FE37